MGAADAGGGAGRIYGGITTPTEASVIAVVYAIIVGMFLHREIGWRDLYPIFRKSVISSAVIMFIIACAGCSPGCSTGRACRRRGRVAGPDLRQPALFLLG
jgi:hypothetical protein